MTTVETLPDHYGILGVPRHVTEDGIRRAYLRKAWQHHPDLHPEDPATVEAMRDVNAAYETLSDPILRTRYDSHRTTIRVRPFDTEPVRVAPGDLRVPRTRHHHRHSRESGVLDAALLFLQRLTRCVSA